jgi:hypothetical protein
MVNRLRVADGERKKAADDASQSAIVDAVNDRDSIRNFLSQFEAAKLGMLVPSSHLTAPSQIALFMCWYRYEDWLSDCRNNGS